ncbi:MAG: hypothetical protein ABIH23_35425, partial [bacterium]
RRPRQLRLGGTRRAGRCLGMDDVLSFGGVGVGLALPKGAASSAPTADQTGWHTQLRLGVLSE